MLEEESFVLVQVGCSDRYFLETIPFLLIKFYYKMDMNGCSFSSFRLKMVNVDFRYSKNQLTPFYILVSLGLG